MSLPSLGPVLEEEHVCFYLVCVSTPPLWKRWLRGNLLAAVFRDRGVEIMWKKQIWYNLPKVNSLRRQMGQPHCTAPAPRALRYQSIALPPCFSGWDHATNELPKSGRRWRLCVYNPVSTCFRRTMESLCSDFIKEKLSAHVAHDYGFLKK